MRSRDGTQRGSREDAVGDVRTAGASNTSDEERSERTASSRLGLRKRSASIYEQRFISKRTGFGDRYRRSGVYAQRPTVSN
ncbi:hypothetical protein [Halorubrum ezzemoulense]|uniref:hypothetical protein n=1 Tax=Halorubrum ezzemoulense TaxID=337243 RepID=UPI0013040A47|nr:hypothetical protein [Halorubrum ezzemoulense]